MATYLILRVYRVPATNQYQATNRMMEALELKVEKHFHVVDIIRAPGAKSGEVLDLQPPPGWKTLFRKQRTGDQ